MVNDWVTLPLSVAVITAIEEAATLFVAIWKLAVVMPAGTVTLLGTLAATLLLDKATSSPPAGAAWLTVTVPVEVAPPCRALGFRASPLTLGWTGGGGAEEPPLHPA